MPEEEVTFCRISVDTRTFTKQTVPIGPTIKSPTSAKETGCCRTHEVGKLHITEKKQKTSDLTFKETVISISKAQRCCCFIKDENAWTC